MGIEKMMNSEELIHIVQVKLVQKYWLIVGEKVFVGKELFRKTI